jgi:Leucine-rich repeat (LRR) protein
MNFSYLVMISFISLPSFPPLSPYTPSFVDDTSKSVGESNKNQPPLTSENPLSRSEPQPTPTNYLYCIVAHPQTLKLGSTSLPSLSHIPKLPKLQDLHIPHNSLSSLEEAPTLFPSLELLNVKGNKLESTQSLECLVRLRDLVEMRVDGNPLCSPNYRTEVLGALPKLEVLDGVSTAV